MIVAAIEGNRSVSSGLSALLLVGIYSAGCSSASSTCQKTFAAQQWPSAIAACAEAMGQGDLTVGGLLASAHLMVGHRTEALQIAERLQGGPARAAALRTIAFAREPEDPTAARDLARQALDLDLSAGNHLEAARDAHVLMGIYWKRGQLSAALSTHGIYAREARLSGDQSLQAASEMARGDLWRRLGDADVARGAYQAALAHLDDRPSTRADVRLKQGRLERELNRPQPARTAFLDALALAERQSRPDIVDAALLNLAWAERVSGRLVEAQGWLGRVIETTSADYSYEKGLQLLAAGNAREAAAVLELAQPQDGQAEAQYYVPMARAEVARKLGQQAEAERHHREAVAGAERILAASREPELRAWIQEARREPYQALVDDLLERSATTEALGVIDRLASRALQDALTAGGALAGSVPGWTPPSAVPAVATAAHEILVNVDGLAHSWLVRVQGDRTFVRDLGPRESLAAVRDRFIADPTDLVVASELGSRLVPADLIRRDDRPLFIVATGDYRRLPYARLRRSGRYLVQDRALAFVPSVSAMTSCRPAIKPAPAVVLGDPEGDLPFARKEAQWVATYLGVKPFIGDSATRGAIYSGAESVLHLAGHAELDVGGARLLMADGALSVQEILQRALPVSSVFLASCASNASRHHEMWGSLTAAFLVAGARHVVATLSSVRDDATFALAQSFYRQGGATDPIGALARAQRTAAKEVPDSHWETFAVSILNDDCNTN